MDALTTSLLVAVAVFLSSLVGLSLHRVVPDGHLSQETRSVILLGTGTLSLLASLVLGLLVATAKASYDTKSNELTVMSANTVMLDRMLAHYGYETRTIRDLLRRAGARLLETLWPQNGQAPRLEPAGGAEVLYDAIEALSPKNDAQRALQSQALNLTIDIGKMRWLLFVQSGSSISTPFLIVLVFWLTIIFMSFGLFAPYNVTVIATLLVCALSVSGAIFMVLQLDSPFEGLIRISSTPVQNALAHLGK